MAWRQWRDKKIPEGTTRGVAYQVIEDVVVRNGEEVFARGNGERYFAGEWGRGIFQGVSGERCIYQVE